MVVVTFDGKKSEFLKSLSITERINVPKKSIIDIRNTSAAYGGEKHPSPASVPFIAYKISTLQFKPTFAKKSQLTKQSLFAVLLSEVQLYNVSFTLQVHS